MVTNSAWYCACCRRVARLVVIICIFILALVQLAQARDGLTAATSGQEASSTTSQPSIDPATGSMVVPQQRSETALGRSTTHTDAPEADRPTQDFAHEPEQSSPDTQLNNSGSLMGTPFPTAADIVVRTKHKAERLRELLVVAPDMMAAKSQQQQLSKLGLRIRQRKLLGNLGLVLSTFQVPEKIDVEEVRGQVEIDFPDFRVETNQIYRPLARDLRHYGQKLSQLFANSKCGSGIRLAMLDSQLVSDLLSDKVKMTDVTGYQSKAHRHGTAVAHLLIGQRDGVGLLPDASLVAINVFKQDKKKELYTTTYWMLAGLDVIAGMKPRPHAVNMSLGGGHSTLLEWSLKHLHKDSWFIAAAGNSGKNTPVYPAAYEEVIAVSAIDHRQRRYRKANTGAYIDFVAPGVDIWTFDEAGEGFYASGTSYATPFATAVFALYKAGGYSKSEIIAGAKDLGQQGKDDVFGHGLVLNNQLCGF